MKKYSVIRYWEVRDEVEVEARSTEEAIEKAHEMELKKGRYVDDSINSDPDCDVQEIGVTNGS